MKPKSAKNDLHKVKDRDPFLKKEDKSQDNRSYGKINSRPYYKKWPKK